MPVAAISNGHRLELVVHRLTASYTGPTLGVIAGIHGDEPLGIKQYGVGPGASKGTTFAGK